MHIMITKTGVYEQCEKRKEKNISEDLRRGKEVKPSSPPAQTISLFTLAVFRTARQSTDRLIEA